MKKANKRRLPLSSWWRGIASGSPSRRARPPSRAAQAARKATVTSERRARWTTRAPAQARKKPKKADEPHCPGETHAPPPESSAVAARPKLVGLKTCLPRTRSTNLLPTARTAALAASAGELVRRSRQRERPEMRALRGSNRGRPTAFPKTYWAPRQTASSRMTRPGPTPKSMPKTPKRRRPVSAAIWKWRGSRMARRAAAVSRHSPLVCKPVMPLLQATYPSHSRATTAPSPSFELPQGERARRLLACRDDPGCAW
jgi:hypothetical protein